MPKKPKSEEVEKNDTWSEDQKDHEYYYDDAHGYEKYEPETDEDEADEDVGQTPGQKSGGGSLLPGLRMSLRERQRPLNFDFRRRPGGISRSERRVRPHTRPVSSLSGLFVVFRFGCFVMFSLIGVFRG